VLETFCELLIVIVLFVIAICIYVKIKNILSMINESPYSLELTTLMFRSCFLNTYEFPDKLKTNFSSSDIYTLIKKLSFVYGIDHEQIESSSIMSELRKETETSYLNIDKTIEIFFNNFSSETISVDQYKKSMLIMIEFFYRHFRDLSNIEYLYKACKKIIQKSDESSVSDALSIAYDKLPNNINIYNIINYEMVCALMFYSLLFDKKNFSAKIDLFVMKKFLLKHDYEVMCCTFNTKR